jgi:hypothetical protein
MTSAINPYESPASIDDDRPLRTSLDEERQRLQRLLFVPGLALIVLGSLQATFAFVMGVVWTVHFVRGAPNWLAVIAFANCLLMVNVALAGQRMLQLRSPLYVQVIALLCCFPYLTPCYVIGLPFGLWATVVLAMHRTELRIPPERFGGDILQ